MRSLETSFKRGCERYGRAVKLVPGAVASLGAEAALTGAEDGALAVKGFFHDPAKERGLEPPGRIDELRAADVAGGKSGEWLFVTAAAYLNAEPTPQWRLVDGADTYAIKRVQPVYRRQLAVAYELLIRLI